MDWSSPGPTSKPHQSTCLNLSVLCFRPSEDIFPCKDCGIWYRSERNLQAHLMYYCASRQKPPSAASSPPQDKAKESYPNERVCPVPQCNKSCPSASSLEIHMRTHSGKSAPWATPPGPRPQHRTLRPRPAFHVSPWTRLAPPQASVRSSASSVCRPSPPKPTASATSRSTPTPSTGCVTAAASSPPPGTSSTATWSPPTWRASPAPTARCPPPGRDCPSWARPRVGAAAGQRL